MKHFWMSSEQMLLIIVAVALLHCCDSTKVKAQGIGPVQQPMFSMLSPTPSIDQGVIAKFVYTDLTNGVVTYWPSQIGSSYMYQIPSKVAPTNNLYGTAVWFNASSGLLFTNLTIAASNQCTIWMAIQPGTTYDVGIDDLASVLTLKHGTAASYESLRWQDRCAWSYNTNRANFNITRTNQAQWMIGTISIVRSNNAGMVTIYGSANGDTYTQGLQFTGNATSSNLVFNYFGNDATESLLDQFSGYLYEIRVYDRFLTDAESLELANYSTNYLSPWYAQDNAVTDIDFSKVTGPDGTTTNAFYDQTGRNRNAYVTNAAYMPYKTNSASIHPAMHFSGAQGILFTNGTTTFSGGFTVPESYSRGITILMSLSCDDFSTTNKIPTYAAGSAAGFFRAGTLMPQNPASSEFVIQGRRLDADSLQFTNFAATVGTRYIVMASFDYYNATAKVYTNGVLASIIQPFQTPGAHSGVSIGTIGYLSYAGNQAFFVGNIERVMYFGKALYDFEARNWYNEMK